MNEAVQNFIQTINGRDHVLQLLDNTELHVRLVEGEEGILIALNNGKVYLQQETDSTLPVYEINGDIKQLLNGTETLRSLVQKGKINITAPFRTILLLESIFYLTKAMENLQENI
ncbi:MAG TPA: hypothetical protein VGI04_00685 [Neobacillus sp.]